MTNSKKNQEHINYKLLNMFKTTSKFLMLFIAVTALCITSCTKEGPQGPVGSSGVDGIDGVNGTNGTNGQDGTNGTNGEDGTDGNANVTSATYDLTSISGTSYTINTNNLTPELVEDGVVLAYVKAGNEWYPVPNQRVLTNGFSLIEISNKYFPFGVYYSYQMVFHRGDTPFTIAAGDLDELRLVFIPEASSISGKSSKNSTLDTFYENGVDPLDYYQVMQYYGFDE